MPYNDHTDAEYERRELAREMGTLAAEAAADAKFDRWTKEAESLLAEVGINTLDGDEETDGFSLDGALDAFEDGRTPGDYVTDVLVTRGNLGYFDGEPDTYLGSVSQHENSGDWYD